MPTRPHMKIYNVTDNDEVDEFFATKDEAVKRAKELKDEYKEKNATLHCTCLYIQYPINKKLICNLLMRQNFVAKRREIKF